MSLTDDMNLQGIRKYLEDNQLIPITLLQKLKELKRQWSKQ